MSDHLKLDVMLDDYLAARRFAEWIPKPDDAPALQVALRQFAHELAQALDEKASPEQDVPPLAQAAETAGRINTILQSRKKPIPILQAASFS